VKDTQTASEASKQHFNKIKDEAGGGECKQGNKI
jgi:hypothetical protein